MRRRLRELTVSDAKEERRVFLTNKLMSEPSVLINREADLVPHATHTQGECSCFSEAVTNVN